MKLKINRVLRAALLSCYTAVAALATSLSTGTIAVGTVALTLLSTQEAQAQTTLTAAGGRIPDSFRNVDDAEYIIVDITAGFFGNAAVIWESEIIYVQNWTVTGASSADSIYAKGNLTDITPALLGEGTATGNVMFHNANGPGSAIPNSYMFDGDHSGFTGDFIMASGNANALDFVFTNYKNTSDTDVLEKVSGTGAIEIGMRADPIGVLPANRSSKVAHFFYRGDVTIENSHINAGRITLNAKAPDGTNTSGNFTTSRNNREDTGAATYNISSVLNLNILEINDDSKAILTGAGSSTDTVLFDGTSTLAIGNGGSLTLRDGETDVGLNNSMSVLSGGSLTLNAGVDLVINGTLILESAIIAQDGSFFDLRRQAIIDIGNLTPTMEGDKAIYKLVEGPVDTFFSGELTWASIRGIDGLTASSHIVVFNEATSSIEIERLDFISYAGSDDILAPAALSWNTTSLSFNGGTVAFANGSNVVFTGHTSATLAQAISAGAITVSANSSLSLSSGGVAANVLSATQVNLSGTLSLVDSDVLHADTDIIFSDAGKIFLNDGVSLNGDNISALENVAIWFEVEAAGTGTITGQVAGSTNMRASGDGLIVLEGSLLAGASTTTIDEGTTLRVNTGSNSGDLKALAGAGTLQFAGNDGGTILNVNNFTGTVAIQEGATGLNLRANQASGNRYDLTYAGTAAVAIQLSSTGTPGGDANRHHIGNLSGNINFSSGSAGGSFKRDTIVLTMTQDNTWSGIWAGATTQDGGLRVGSAAGENYKFTITQGLNGAAGHNGWNALEIRNSTVAFAEGGTWNTSILFADATSELRYEGNSQTITNVGTGEQADAYVSASFSEQNSVDVTDNNFGSIVVDTKADENVITVSRANTDYRGTVSVESGTLSITDVNAFVNASAMSISGGALNLNNLAITKDIAASGGMLTGLAGYTGQLDITGAVTVDGVYQPKVTIANTGSLTLLGTWDFNTTLVSAGDVILGADMTLDLTGVIFDGNHSVQLVSDVDLLDATAWLTATGELDLDKVIGLNMEGRSYSYENGVIKFTLNGTTHLVTGGDMATPLDFQLAVGTMINGAPMANGDNITFSNYVNLEMTEDVRAILVTIAENAVVNAVDSQFALSGEFLVLESNSILNAGDTLDVSTVNMADGSALSIDSIPEVRVGMVGASSLTVNDTLAAGIVFFTNVEGESESELNLKFADAGTVLNIPNFAGTINVLEGQLTTNIGDFETLGGVNLADTTSYTISGTLQTGAQDLSKIEGSGTLSIQGVGNITETGEESTDRVSLTLADTFTGQLQLNAGLLDVTNTNLGGSSDVRVQNSGFIATVANGTISHDIVIVDGSDFIARANAAASFTHTGSITGGVTTTIAKTDGGTVTIAGDLTNFAGSLSVREGKMILDTDALNIQKLSIWNEEEFELTAGHTLTTTAKDDGREFYALVANHSYNLIIGAGSTINDNLYLRQGEGKITISGGGTYNIVGYMGSDGDANRASILDIDTGTTVSVSGNVTTDDADLFPSFMLAHWPGTAEINIKGTLNVTAGISNRDGTGVINVESGGTLSLGQGLYGVDNDSGAAVITINAKDGATVRLHNQATTGVAGVLVADFAGGSTIEALDAETNITNAIRLSGTGAVTLTADDVATEINVASVISDATDNAASLNISTKVGQTFTISGANTFTTGLSVTGAGSVFVDNVSALGTGVVSFTGDTLDLNNLAVANNITVAGGSIDNFGGYTGTVSINGTVNNVGALNGSAAVLAGGDFTLGGTLIYNTTIENAGTLTLAASLVLDLTDAVISEIAGIQIFKNDDATGTSDISDFVGPDNTLIHDQIIGVVSIGRKFILSDDGLLTYTLTGKSIESNEATITWADGAELAGQIFDNEDSITFVDTNVTATLGGDVLAARVTVETGLELIVNNTDPNAYTLAVGEIFLEEDASMVMDNANLTVTEANLATGSLLSMGSLGDGKATLTGTASLILTDGLVAGAQSLGKVTGGAESSLTVSSDATGDDVVTLTTPNFTGSLNLADGAFATDLANHGTYANVHIGATASYSVADRLAAVYTVENLSADAGGTLKLNLSTDGANGTTLTMSDTFMGNIEVLSGTLSALSTTAGLAPEAAPALTNVGKVTFADGTSLVFNQVAVHTFTPDMELADSANVSMRTWGDIAGNVIRVLEGELIGAANTTLTKIDGGVAQLNNIDNFAGSIVISDDIGGPGKLIINSNAAGLNNITLETGTLLDITGAGNVVNTAIYSGGSTTTIAADASLMVTGETASATVGDAASFQLVGTVNVGGLLSVNSAISNQGAAGTINVQDGGTLVLEKGLYTVYNANASTINVMDGASVKIGNQTEASSNAAGTDAHLVVNFAAGSSITATDTTTNILNNINMTGDGVVTLTGEAAVTNVSVDGVLSGAAGLAVTGAAGQVFSLNAANTYTGLTSVDGGATLVVGNANALATSSGVTVTNGTLDLSATTGINLNGALSVNANSSLTMLAVNGSVAVDSLVLAAGEKATIGFSTALGVEFDVQLFSGLTADGSITGINFDVEGKADAGDYFAGLLGELTYDQAAGTLSYNNYDLNDLVWKGGSGNFSDADGWETQQGVSVPLDGTDKSITIEATTPTGPVFVTVDAAYSVVDMTVTGAGANYTFSLADLAADSLTIQEQLVVDAGASATFSFAPSFNDGIGILVGENGTLTLHGADALTIETLTNEGTFNATNYDIVLSYAIVSMGDITARSLNLATGANSFNSVVTTDALDLATGDSLKLSATSSMGRFTGSGNLELENDADLTIIGAASIGTLTSNASVTIGAGNNTITELDNSADLSSEGNLTITTVTTGGSLTVGRQEVVGVSPAIESDLTLSSGASFNELIVTGDVISTGNALSVAGGSQVLGTVTASSFTLTENSASIGGLAAGATLRNEGTGSLHIASSVDVASLSNDGTVDITGDLTVATAVSNGGNVETTGGVILRGENSFTSINADGAITKHASSTEDLRLSVSEDSSASYLEEGMALKVNGDTTVFTLDHATADTVLSNFSGGGSLDIAGTGALELQSASSGNHITMAGNSLSLNGTLTLTGDLTTAADTLTLNLNYDIKSGPALTANSVTGATGINLGISFDQLEELRLSHQGSYALTDVTDGFTNTFDLSFADATATGEIWKIDNRSYILGVDDSGQISVTLSITGNTWQSTTGVWDDSAANWNGEVPGPGDTAFFLGGGSMTVQVSGDKVVGELRVQGDYSFSGSKVTADSFAHTDGVLSISNDIDIVGTTTISNAGTVMHLTSEPHPSGGMQPGNLFTHYLDITAGATLKIDRANTLYVGVGATDISQVNEVLGTIENEGTVNLRSANPGLQYEINTLTGIGALYIADGALVTIDTLQQNYVDLDGTSSLSLKQNSHIGVLSGTGEIDAVTLTLTDDGSESTASIVVTDLIIDGKENSLGAINAETLTLNGDLVDTADALLSVESIEGKTAGSAFELSLDDQLIGIGHGTYSLISSGSTLSWGNVTWDAESLGEIQDLIISGMDITYTDDGGTLGFTLSEATNRIWTVSNNFAASEGLAESSPSAIKPIYTATADGGVLVNYRVLDSVDTVVVDQNFTLDLSGQPADIHGAVLRETMGTGTLTLVGGKATLQNAKQSALSGLSLDGTELDVHRSEVAGSISINNLNATGADIEVSEGGRMSVTNATLTDTVLTVGDVIGYTGNASSLTAGNITLDGASSVTVLATTTTNRALTNPVGLEVTNKLTLNDTATNTVDGGAAEKVKQLDANDDSQFIVRDGGQAYIGTADLADNASLSATGTGYIEIDQIASSVETNEVEGHLIVGNGTYNGGYSSATTFETKADGKTSIITDDRVSVVGNQGSDITLRYNAADATNNVASLSGTGSTIYVEKTGLNVLNTSTLTNSTVHFQVDTTDLVNLLDKTNYDPDNAIDLFSDSSQLTMSGSSIIIDQVDPSVTTLDLSNVDTTQDLVIFNVNAEGATDKDITFAEGSVYSTYFSGVTVNSQGQVTIVFNREGFAPKVSSHNGLAGAKILSPMIFSTQTGDLADAISAMNTAIGADADRIAAATAGSSVTSMGTAMLAAVERQLQNVRNRTASIAANPYADDYGVITNAWISGEGSFSRLDADGTASGHEYSSWGGSFGVDFAVSSETTLGFALTTLYGTLDSDAADIAEGDLNTYSLTAFANYTSNRWSHTFLASISLAEASLDRTVALTEGNYATQGETDGMGIGLMYELGYDYALDEEETMSLQPVFNLSLVHASIDGYTETGSNAALDVGSQDNTYVTFGLGARFESQIGESTFNRTGTFTSHVMLKLDAGDRYTETDVRFVGQTASGNIKGSEAGAVGLEVGAGFNIPVGNGSGILFMDASVEVRDQYSNVNGTMGYRFTF